MVNCEREFPFSINNLDKMRHSYGFDACCTFVLVDTSESVLFSLVQYVKASAIIKETLHPDKLL